MPTMIRPITPLDAEALTALFAVVDSETTFLLAEPGERDTTADTWRARITAMQAEGVGAMFVAEDAGALVGFLSAQGDTRRRVRHVVHLFVAIRQSHVGQGIGTQLFVTMEAWARRRGVHRLQLHVASENERAIALYRKMGFVTEGLHRHAVYVNKQYVDDYTMAKLLE